MVMMAERTKLKILTIGPLGLPQIHESFYNLLQECKAPHIEIQYFYRGRRDIEVGTLEWETATCTWDIHHQRSTM